MNNYIIGDYVQVTATFTNAAGTNVDPTTVSFFYRNPDSTITVGSATKVSTGIYTANITCAQSGQYSYRFVGTGAATAANEGAFLVNNSAFSFA